MANRRIFYATQAVGFGALSSSTYTAGHGVDSVGVNTNFTLDQVLELGLISVYQLVEQVPEIEVTVSKVLDGYPLLYHLSTQGSPNATLVGRSNQRCMFAISVYTDTQQQASGTPVSQMICSGMYWSSLNYAFGTDSPFKENLTLVGNNKYWITSGFSFQPAASVFLNDSPLAIAGSGGVNIRKDFIFYPVITGAGMTGYSQERLVTLDANGQALAFFTNLPPDIPGISSSGTNDKDSSGAYGAHVTAVNTSVSVGRDSILELGRKEPYFRFANFPVEVNSDITIVALQGDMINATEAGVNANQDNLVNRSIRIRAREGTWIDLGYKNKLSSVSYSGGDTGGGQVNVTYSYKTYNDFTVTHPHDPSIANCPWPF